MSDIDVREIQRPLRRAYQERPEEARYTYRVRAVAGGDALHAEVISEAHGGARWQVSVKERVGGSGGEPTPGDLLLGALAACKLLAIRMVANAARVELDEVTKRRAAGDRLRNCMTKNQATQAATAAISHHMITAGTLR